MKICLLFLFVFSFQMMAINSNAQDAVIKVNTNSITVSQLINEIEKQTDYLVVYSNREVDTRRKVDILQKSDKVSSYLNEAFSNSDIGYNFENNYIVLSKKAHQNATAIAQMIQATQQQEKVVTGKVTDENGDPIIGATIVEKENPSHGTITDYDGNFTLSNLPENATLQFTYVGMKPQEVAVNGRKTINTTMEPDTELLDELVVVGYGVQKKATLTGSIGTVKAEELVKRPVANSTELLQGQIAGLITRQSSGLPGADGTTLNIRGFGNPLVLVDGIQGSFAQLDPNDIESINVLKDASAAVYGARAGSGVILISTKRGVEKPSTINYNGSISIASPTFLPNMVGAGKWAEMLYESGLNPDDYSPNHVKYDPATKTLNNILDGNVYKGYDWADALYRTWTPQQQHNLSASGGTRRIKYFASVGFTEQISNFKSGDYDFERYNIRSNIDAMISDNLSISVDFAYRRTVLDKANFNVNEMYNSLQVAKPVYPVVNPEDPTKATYSGFLQRSPYYQTFKEYSGFINNKVNALQGAIELKYSFPKVKGLVAKARLSYEDIFSWNKNVSKPFDVYSYDPIAARDGGDPWTKQGTQNTNNMSVYSDRGNELIPLFTLEYDKSFGRHNIKGMIASETRTYKGTSLNGSRKDILSYEAPYLRYASEEGKDNNEGTSKNARSSVIGRVNYDYSGKYLFEFAMRADASGEYAPKGRWGYFPSFSAGWRISEEPFIRDNFKAVDNLKLRASYGVLGNDAVSSFDYLTGYNITTNYYIFGSTPEPVISSAGLANPDITWETMKISNIGLDGTFWGGLLGFEIDVFYRLRKNILAEPTQQIPSTFGASLPKTNLNKRDNRGFELTLTHRNKIGKVTYEVSPMISYSRGKYVKLQEEISDDPEWNARYVQEGHWDDREWGYITEGFFMNQQQIDDYTIDQDQAGNQTIKVGDLIYKDLNDDKLIDWHDQAVIGKNELPNVMYSLKTNVEYKGFGLSLLFQGATDYVVTIGGSAAAPFSNESIPLDYQYKYRAIVGTDTDGKAYITNPDIFKLPPVSQTGRTANNSKASDFWTRNATFLRLKNLNFNYTIPAKLTKKAGINQCTLYFSGTNLWTISNRGIWKNSFDPEIINQNNKDYPPVKTLTFGLRLTK